MASKDFVTGGNKTERYLQKISSGIKMALDNIGDVIWAVRNDQANEKSISSRIKDFFIDVFDARGIECTYEIDSESEDSITGILSRKYLLLIVKETINNAIKHSGANCIKVKLNTVDNFLHLSVEDNGKGIDEGIINSETAFSSLRNRTSKLGGSITIQNANRQGALVECVFPITTIREK
jgi:signal transduction histidine kinase